MKISFTGDLTCDKPLLKAAYLNDEFHFENVFFHVSELFRDSQYVVSNLETTFSEEGNYNKKAYCYNSPKVFLDAACKAGINIFSIANNHCCDGGLPGLKNTVSELEKRNLLYMGYKGRSCTVQQDGQRVTFLSYTYGINDNGYDLEDIEKSVNVLRPYARGKDTGFRKVIPMSWRRRIRKTIRLLKGKPTLAKSVDDYPVNESFCEKIKEDIRDAKENSDFVCVYPHMGGQFNLEIGSFSRTMAKCFEDAGADLIVANHAHIVQKYENETIPIFYCLGGLSISPSASYLIQDDMPQYSIVVHLYISEKKHKLTFSIIKCVEDENGYVTIWPVDSLYKSLTENNKRHQLKKEAVLIYNRLLSTNVDWEDFELKKEYEIKEVKSNV
ncbi:MAG: CapA family protein [Eubacteriales bacterium]|nr:CapA family protein [Eubacteriales bacterium]